MCGAYRYEDIPLFKLRQQTVQKTLVSQIKQIGVCLRQRGGAVLTDNFGYMCGIPSGQ